MSISLYRNEGNRDDECLDLTHNEWDDICRLGRKFGWKPTGTGPPKGWNRTQTHPWSGHYNRNDGQLFYAPDARALARALATALVELPSVRKEELIDEVILFLEDGRFRIS